MEVRVLNLGAGAGSAPIVYMALMGEVAYDCAIFADTQDEPAWVYRQLAWLERQGGPPIHRVSGGDLMKNLRVGKNNNGGRFVSIPAFTRLDNGEVAMTRRQCTREYKIEPVEQFIRRELLGLKPRQRIPSNVTVTQLFGFSVDEAGLAARMRKQEGSRWKFEFPLIEAGMRKGECYRIMDQWCKEFPWMWSSCRSCPFHSDRQWRQLRELSPDDFENACRNDESLREHGNVVNRNMDSPMYIHRSCVPLRDVDFDSQGELFDLICDGGCHT